jgi:hypothetical protein
LRELLLGAEPPDVGLVRIERLGKAVEDAERPQDPQQVLQADTALATLEADDSVARDPRSVGQLNLGQAAQLPPGGRATGYVAESSTDGRGRLATHIADIIGLNAVENGLYRQD